MKKILARIVYFELIVFSLIFLITVISGTGPKLTEILSFHIAMLIPVALVSAAKWCYDAMADHD